MSEWCERFHESQESNEDDPTDGLQKSVTTSEAMKCQTGDFEARNQMGKMCFSGRG